MPVMNRVIAVVVLLATGCLTARTQTNTTPAACTPTQLIILGTLHGGHQANTNYSLEGLRRLIVALQPAAILVEQPPAIGGHPTVQKGRVVKALAGRDEDWAANQAADDLGVNVIPFDREGRNEFYRNTRYFPRRDAANERFNKWLDLQGRKAAGSIQLLAAQLQSDAIGRQNRFLAAAGPELINSPAYDMIIATKLSMAYGVIPQLLAAAGERDLAAEFIFISDEWQERNRIMARNIVDTARQFTGKRLVVLTGSEHRYLLRELLAKVPELELKEYYQVPGVLPLPLRSSP